MIVLKINWDSSESDPNDPNTPSACQAGGLTPQGEQQVQAAALEIAEFELPSGFP